MGLQARAPPLKSPLLSFDSAHRHDQTSIPTELQPLHFSRAVDHALSALELTSAVSIQPTPISNPPVAQQQPARARTMSRGGRGGFRGGGGGGGGFGRGKIGGQDVPWEYDPELKVETKPSELFPVSEGSFHAEKFGCNSGDPNHKLAAAPASAAFRQSSLTRPPPPSPAPSTAPNLAQWSPRPTLSTSAD